jgi:FkbM family methyltransferase
MIRIIIKKILRILNWKLVKIKRKKPIEYYYGTPNLSWVKSIMNSNGILHIGAHRGSEAQVYNWFNKKVIWIEANPELYEDLKDNIENFYNQSAYLALLGDEEKKQNFFISNKDASCSSIFDFSNKVKKKELWKNYNLKMEKKIILEMKTLDNWAEQNGINLENFNHWIIDVQGSELKVLNGAKNSLTKCKSILVEISKLPYYDTGSTEWSELKQFMLSKKFYPENEPSENHCDVLFTKNS